jgi:hypothetical protein
MAMPALKVEPSAQDYSIAAKISPIEWHLIQHVRHLRAHGYGKLTVEVARNRVVQCRSEQSDNPGELIDLQETEGPGG